MSFGGLEVVVDTPFILSGNIQGQNKRHKKGIWGNVCPVFPLS